MRLIRVFHGQVVQVALLLDCAEERLVGLVEPDPDELTFAGERAADLVDAERRYANATGIRRSVDDRARAWKVGIIAVHRSGSSFLGIMPDLSP